MEWVETTGRTIDEALDAALDQLGVDEDEAEFEVLEEPKVGLFGRLRGEARIRARVRPTKPRAKEDRRERRRRPGRSGSAAETAGRSDGAETEGEDTDDTAEISESPPRPARARSGRKPANGGAVEEAGMTDTGTDVPLDEQGEVAATFVRGLLEQFGYEASVALREIDEDTLEVTVDGGDLGLLIGPKGVTLSAVQDLMRTVVQRKTSARNGRLLLDISGYRQRRKEALERFATSAAEQVVSTKTRVVLEPMSAADRKIIHDTVNDIEGVRTTSEGEEPRRRVVLLPD